jgi:ferredoxin
VARLAARLDENAPGAFFVDDSCIDCDACRVLAPATFARSRRLGQSYVAAQPAGSDGEARALMAIVACPTASIGTSPKRPLGAAPAAFPECLDADV